MPPRKEPKETVVYPASKRKAPPFKPQRPSPVPRISTTGSESTNPKNTPRFTTAARRVGSVRDEEEDDDSNERRDMAADNEDGSDSEEELAANPLAARPAKASKATKPPPPRRKPPRQPSPMSVSSDDMRNSSPERLSAPPDPPPLPSQLEDTPSIPQPLLIRLLHEHFADKTTKIDKNAIQILQKYFEVFVHETIARAAARKKEDAEKRGGVSDFDVSWLEVEDLEKVAAGMMLDF